MSSRVFIASGGFGDVYKPPIPCPNIEAKYLTDKYVGKLFIDTEAAQDELENDSKLKSLDPHGLFALTPVAYCRTNLSQSEMNTLTNVPRLTKNTSDQRKERKRTYNFQIISPFGGESFFNFIKVLNRVGIQDLLNPILFLFKKVGYMNNNNFYHFDLKYENILYNNDKGLLYLIDFGWSGDTMKAVVSTFIEKTKYNQNKTDYTFSPDILLARCLASNQPVHVRLINYLLPNSEMFQYGKINLENYKKYFYSHSKWYSDENTTADTFDVMKKGSMFYKELQRLVNNFKKISNPTIEDYQPLIDFFNQKKIIKKQESMSFGFVIFNWLYLSQLNTNSQFDKKLISDIATIVCNDLIVFNFENRKTIKEAYTNVLNMLQKNYPEIYEKYKRFEDITETKHISPEKEKISDILKKDGVPALASPYSKRAKTMVSESTKKLDETKQQFKEIEAKRKLEYSAMLNQSVELDKQKATKSQFDISDYIGPIRIGPSNISLKNAIRGTHNLSRKKKLFPKKPPVVTSWSPPKTSAVDKIRNQIRSLENRINNNLLAPRISRSKRKPNTNKSRNILPISINPGKLPARNQSIPAFPRERTGSPAFRIGSPAFRRGSPTLRRGSPAFRNGSPAFRRGSPAFRRASPPREIITVSSTENEKITERPQPIRFTMNENDSPPFRPGFRERPTFRTGSPAFRTGSPAFRRASPPREIITERPQPRIIRFRNNENENQPVVRKSAIGKRMIQNCQGASEDMCKQSFNCRWIEPILKPDGSIKRKGYCRKRSSKEIESLSLPTPPCKGVESQPICLQKEICDWREAITRKNGIRIKSHCRKRIGRKRKLNSKSKSKEKSKSKKTKTKTKSKEKTKTKTKSKEKTKTKTKSKNKRKNINNVLANNLIPRVPTREKRIPETIPAKNIKFAFKNHRFYRDKYPIPIDIKSKDFRFYSEFIRDFHDDYQFLEEFHAFIQWLFPLFTKSRFNPDAQPLTQDEVESMRNDSIAMKNLIKSFKMMLNFYGFTFGDNDGNIVRTSNWRERFENLKNKPHNYDRITRILNCLNIFGFRKFAKKFLDALQKNIFLNNRPLHTNRIFDSFKRFWTGFIEEKNYPKSDFIDSFDLVNL
jgi:hypothetical protein